MQPSRIRFPFYLILENIMSKEVNEKPRSVPRPVTCWWPVFLNSPHVQGEGARVGSSPETRLRTEDVSSGLIPEGGQGVFNFSVIFLGGGGRGVHRSASDLQGGIYHSVIDYQCDLTWHLHVYIIT